MLPPFPLGCKSACGVWKGLVMKMKVSGVAKEYGIVIGNAFDKYGSRNPLVRWIMRGFESSLDQLITKASPSSIHEIGCR